MGESNGRHIPWALFVSELIGTALLVLVGLSLVILMFGAGTPMARLIPERGAEAADHRFPLRDDGRLHCAVSGREGERSAHQPGRHPRVPGDGQDRPADRPSDTSAAQLIGAVVGSLPLLLWGAMGRSVAFGATLPGPGTTVSTALLGEAITTFAMVALLAVFLAFRTIRPFTPAIFPPLYAIMVWAESPISGTSTNPARSLGPSVISGQWQGWWIYWIGPMAGMLLAVLACSFLAKRIEVAKLYHFDSDHDRLFRRMARPT